MSTAIPSTASLYGFVGYVFSYASFGLLIFWALAPEGFLPHAVFLPSKHWLLAVPAWLVVLWVYLDVVNYAAALIRAPAFNSPDAMEDEFSGGTRGTLNVTNGTFGSSASTLSSPGCTSSEEGERTTSEDDERRRGGGSGGGGGGDRGDRRRRREELQETPPCFDLPLAQVSACLHS